MKRQADKEAVDSRKAVMEQLSPEQQVAHAERQAWPMPTSSDAASTRLETPLCPNWVQKQETKPRGSDLPRPYKTHKEDANRGLTLEEELDANSVFDPLVSGSQSSQPWDSQPSSTPDTTTEAAGPKTPPHFCEASATIPPFDLTLLGMPAPMSPMMEGENALLNLVLGSPVKSSVPPVIDRGARGSGWSSCSDSPMSLGSPAISSSLAIALKVHARAVTPALFDTREELSEESNDEEEMDATDDSAKDETN